MSYTLFSYLELLVYSLVFLVHFDSSNALTMWDSHVRNLWDPNGSLLFWKIFKVSYNVSQMFFTIIMVKSLIWWVECFVTTVSESAPQVFAEDEKVRGKRPIEPVQPIGNSFRKEAQVCVHIKRRRLLSLFKQYQDSLVVADAITWQMFHCHWFPHWSDCRTVENVVHPCIKTEKEDLTW